MLGPCSQGSSGTAMLHCSARPGFGAAARYRVDGPARAVIELRKGPMGADRAGPSARVSPARSRGWIGPPALSRRLRCCPAASLALRKLGPVFRRLLCARPLSPHQALLRTAAAGRPHRAASVGQVFARRRRIWCTIGWERGRAGNPRLVLRCAGMREGVDVGGGRGVRLALTVERG